MALRKLLAFVAPLLFVAQAEAASYDRLYVFGDSLVDSGNAQIASPLFGLPDPAKASDGYVAGRFSNGLNYADDLSQRLGLGPATAFLQGGTNYAVGGATATTIPDHTLPDTSNDLIPSFAEQIALYQSSLAGVLPPPFPNPLPAPLPPVTRPAIDANSLVLVTFGGNDVRDFLKYGTPDLNAVPGVLQSGIDQLIGLGARNFVIVGLPDIGKIPSVIAAGATAQAYGTTFSASLSSAFAGVTALENAKLGATGSARFVDLFTLQDQLELAPASAGLDPTKLGTSCQADGAQSTGCAGYLFFDGIHPTAQVHSIIASRIADQLGLGAAPEPATWLTMIVGFGLVGFAMRRRGARLAA